MKSEQRLNLTEKEKGSKFSFEVTPEMFRYMDGQFEVPATEQVKNLIIINSY